MLSFSCYHSLRRPRLRCSPVLEGKQFGSTESVFSSASSAHWSSSLSSLDFTTLLDTKALTPTNMSPLFDHELLCSKPLLVEFYRPTCPHCQAFAPKYVELARILRAAGSRVVLAKVDTSDESNAGLKKYVLRHHTCSHFEVLRQ